MEKFKNMKKFTEESVKLVILQLLAIIIFIYIVLFAGTEVIDLKSENLPLSLKLVAVLMFIITRKNHNQNVNKCCPLDPLSVTILSIQYIYSVTANIGMYIRIKNNRFLQTNI